MPADTLTIALTGEVTLADFNESVARFHALVDALTDHAGGRGAIEWVVTELQAGSAEATIRAKPATKDAWPAIERVVSSYIEVGAALERGAPPPFPEPVQRTAVDLLGVLSGAIESIRFETADDDAVVSSDSPRHATPPAVRARPSYGSVQGRVQTLSSRGALRFTVYDLLHDRAVSCYLAEGQEQLMRDAWGRIAEVAGFVSRETQTGRPVTVRRVTQVRVLPETDPDGYRKARAVVAFRNSDPAERQTRRQRDAS